MINLLFFVNVIDVMIGYRVFLYFFVKIYFVLFKGFEVEIEMMIYSFDNNIWLYELFV